MFFAAQLPSWRIASYRRLSTLGLACLESSNPKNIPLYERHGFELLGTIQVGASPPIFPMLRKIR